MSFSSSYDMLLNKKITHYNLFLIPKPTQLASWYNAVQKIAAESRLGIPLTISTDPRYGSFQLSRYQTTKQWIFQMAGTNRIGSYR